MRLTLADTDRRCGGIWWLNGREFYYTEAWRQARYKTFCDYGGHCLCCGTRGTPDNPIQVDHIKPRSRYPGLALDLNNLQPLCLDCNRGKGTRDMTDWRQAANDNEPVPTKHRLMAQKP